MRSDDARLIRRCDECGVAVPAGAGLCPRCHSPAISLSAEHHTLTLGLGAAAARSLRASTLVALLVGLLFWTILVWVVFFPERRYQAPGGRRAAPASIVVSTVVPLAV